MAERLPASRWRKVLEPFLFRSIAAVRSSVSPIVVSNVASRRLECLLYLVHERMSKSLLA
jgi:hypothetical protein